MSRLLYPINIERCLSPNFSHRPRGLDSVEGGIIHWTGTRGASAMAVAKYLANPAVDASCWCAIGTAGDIVISVPLSKAAWHAGLAGYDFNDNDRIDPGEMAVNSRMWGIEFCGSYGGPWPNKQMYSGAYMIRRADRKCPNFRLRDITDHQAVARPHGRKVDVDSSFRCEAIFHWVEHPYTRLPCNEPFDPTPSEKNRHQVYKTLPLWARRNCDAIWKS
jgi:N-acetyl-anhydromuramyl-L-alanine amidase AmpD